MERILFNKKLPPEIWTGIKYENRETLQKYLEVNLLNQIYNVIIYETKIDISSLSDVELLITVHQVSI